jgi:hypothetical protein
MMRSVAFGNRHEADPKKAANTAKMMVERLYLLSPAEEEVMLKRLVSVTSPCFMQLFPSAGGSQLPIRNKGQALRK